MLVGAFMNIIEKEYFLKVDSYFKKLRKNYFRIEQLLMLLEQKGNIILVGGSIRDILINNKKPRDIDFIIDTDEDIGEILTKYENCKRNRFGGYKLTVDGIEFDIWKIVDHWAFKKKILETKVSNLKHSTFLNFDSLFYDITLRKIIDIDIFNKCMNDEILDIILEDKYIDDNPFKDINVLRMLVIMDKWKLKLSDKSRSYIWDWVIYNKDSYSYKLYEAQIKHYRKKIIDDFTIEKIIGLL